MCELLKNLNEYQKNAVIDEDKALLLNASVGSGKTTVLVHKILYLYHVKKVPLREMVVLTFTNKAAQEIKKRVLASGILGIDSCDLINFGTFHSVAKYLLSNMLPISEIGYTKDFDIVDQAGLQELFDSVINTHGLNIKYRKKLDKRLDCFKTGSRLYGNMKYDDEIEKLAAIMKQEKIKRNIMDFDDLIENCAYLLKEGYFKPTWIIIDEFQDTNDFQLDMVDGMIGENTHVFAVGDPNQIIYSWRGSRQDIFTIFKERYSAAIKTLPVNYRSTGTILEAAKVFLNNPASLEGIRDKGTPIIIKRHYNSFNEALYISEIIKRLSSQEVPLNEIAIFYRKQKQSAVFEDVFKREGIPFEVSVRKALKDIPVLYWFLRVIKASLNERDTDSLIYVLKDERYGMSFTPKQIRKLIDKKGNYDYSGIPIIVKKIMGFKGWCQDFSNITELESSMYKYFDMDEYLSPTSIYYDEDRGFVFKFINELKEYIIVNNCEVLGGIRKFIEHTTLYGSQVINDLIHPEKESVKLMTLHASKGLEFKYVFISGANYGAIPLGGRLDDEEEKRLFFVGITRARDYLEISYHSNPSDYNVLPEPSPYIRMIPQELIESDELKSRAHKLSELRKEIKTNIEKKKTEIVSKKIAVHDKYGEGYIISESDDFISVMFDGYGEKSFSKQFCPLKFI